MNTTMLLILAALAFAGGRSQAVTLTCSPDVVAAGSPVLCTMSIGGMPAKGVTYDLIDTTDNNKFLGQFFMVGRSPSNQKSDTISVTLTTTGTKTLCVTETSGGVSAGCAVYATVVVE